MSALCCWCSVCGARILCCLNNVFSFDDLVFSLRSKAEEVRKKIPQTGRNMGQIHKKCSPGDPWGGAGGVKTAAGGKGTKKHKKVHIFNAHRVAFGAFSVPLMPKWAPFWTPLDFEGVPKWSNFVQNQHKV